MFDFFSILNPVIEGGRKNYEAALELVLLSFFPLLSLYCFLRRHPSPKFMTLIGDDQVDSGVHKKLDPCCPAYALRTCGPIRILPPNRAILRPSCRTLCGHDLYFMFLVQPRSVSVLASSTTRICSLLILHHRWPYSGDLLFSSEHWFRWHLVKM